MLSDSLVRCWSINFTIISIYKFFKFIVRIIIIKSLPHLSCLPSTSCSFPELDFLFFILFIFNQAFLINTLLSCAVLSGTCIIEIIILNLDQVIVSCLSSYILIRILNHLISICTNLIVGSSFKIRRSIKL